MSGKRTNWVPVVLLLAGAVLTLGSTRTQRTVPLMTPLADVIPAEIDGWVAEDIEVSEAEQQVAGMDEYVMRVYAPAGEDATFAGGFSIYVGYYETQSQGNTIHSPRNCLPGGGWEPLVASRERIATDIGEIPVNRYLIGNGPAKALVLYWYQGRGRVEANEYVVKWDLLRDQALMSRSDEALVRVIVPVTDTDEVAYEKAVHIAGQLAGWVDAALPPRDLRRAET